MNKLITVVLLASSLALTGCYDSTSIKEQELTEANQERLLSIQPPVQLDWSLEREQINKRTKL